jgi:3-methylcrotonyl-CoA carboxylase alpha subunit
MFDKILIANRGEIAVRIIATCQEMGIRTVAVFSEPDRHACHVRAADESYLIGPAPATQSYLSIPAIVATAQRSGAQAIHPGYGFLSENADFAGACQQAGITFIGPPASAIRLMGSKIAAKQLAQSLDVPVVSGYTGAQQDADFLYQQALLIGFPLLIKASAGGGGKGMREVHDGATFFDALAGAQREARAAFGDDAVFLEKLIVRPRHIEIQILGDCYGHMLHLGERECSIQRRHQKIVEESPSLAISHAQRARMGSAAVQIATAAGYSNAGTIEFLLGEDQHFYFLEMNTRLQVEHPVTEQVTGLDLVRHQILIAAGEPLSLTQEQIIQHGHSIEVRLYAEDPAHDFLPSSGTIEQFYAPQGPGIRVDSGVSTGDVITPFYDPMIAKLIVSGEDRLVACERLQRALTHIAIFGVTTNLPFLHAIAVHPAFLAGATPTSFLQDTGLATNWTKSQPDLPPAVLLAAALFETTSPAVTPTQPDTIPVDPRSPWPLIPNPWFQQGPWRAIGITRTCIYHHQQKTHTIALVQLSQAQDQLWSASIDDQPPESISYTLEQANLVLLRRGTQTQHIFVSLTASTIRIIFQGQSYQLQRRQPPEIATTAHSTSPAITQKKLTAPMAGTLVKLQVQPGEQVHAQQVLAILSAMKMEHAIISPSDGTIARILAQEGDVVKGGATLIELV